MKKDCLYCDSKEVESDLHFVCECCGNGMCDDCYNEDKEHDSHYNKPMEDEEFCKHTEQVKIACGTEEPEYLCEACVGKIQSSTTIKKEEVA
jgi:hypothetical protein